MVARFPFNLLCILECKKQVKYQYLMSLYQYYSFFSFMQDLFTISLGWFIFGGLPFDLLNVLGQLLGFVGSGLYAYYKLMGK
uniref:Putative ovule protein n=1 Tax=Solanum chacoense TaxID=4108 RepID=A0A0V0H712_SOLCH